MHKVFKAGTYYIGDPCYLFEQSWEKILDDNKYFESENQFINGLPVAVGSTCYGDGTYTDNLGRKYSVDAGIIGILPIELIDLDKKLSLQEIQNDDELAHIFSFDIDFSVDIKNGVFNFYNIFINTKYYNVVEDEYYSDFEENDNDHEDDH